MENAETQLIPHLHNPFVIPRLIFTSGLSELGETLMWPRDGETWWSRRSRRTSTDNWEKGEEQESQLCSELFVVTCCYLPTSKTSTNTSKAASFRAPPPKTSCTFMETNNSDKPVLDGVFFAR